MNLGSGQRAITKDAGRLFIVDEDMSGGNAIALMLPCPPMQVFVQCGDAAGETAPAMVVAIEDCESKRHTLALRQASGGIHGLLQACVGAERVVQRREEA